MKSAVVFFFLHLIDYNFYSLFEIGLKKEQLARS
jgi:hypothetical protein